MEFHAWWVDLIYSGSSHVALLLSPTTNHSSTLSFKSIYKFRRILYIIRFIMSGLFLLWRKACLSELLHDETVGTTATDAQRNPQQLGDPNRFEPDQWNRTTCTLGISLHVGCMKNPCSKFGYSRKPNCQGWDDNEPEPNIVKAEPEALTLNDTNKVAGNFQTPTIGSRRLL